MENTDRYLASQSDDGRYRLLIEAVTDCAIYMLDSNGIVTSWNPGAQRFKGYSAKEIIGQHFSRFYTEEDRASGLPARALETARKEGKFEHEGWRVRKDGTRFWAYVIIDPIRSPQGEIVGFAKVTRDLTERREAQLRLDQTREALIQSQKMDAIGQLTGGIAHDFNNLLMAVLGSLELMRKRLPDDPKLHTLLENAVQGARRGSTLIQRMLSFARRQDLTQEAVNIPDLVRNMTDLLQRSLGPAIEIHTRFPLVIAPALTDANQLEMALLNLTVNARDAMPQGGKIIVAASEETVTAQSETSLAPGRYIRLSVQDSGNGMDVETLRRAAEPFFTTKGPGKGTGLGLSMVHGLAEQCGGGFAIKSTLGDGTTAELWFPVASSVPAILQQNNVPEQAASHSSLVVLAVDDDPLVLTNTMAMLEDLGHVGMNASSAREALDILKNNSDIDLVITDHAMPHMTGLQFISELRKKWPTMPVILATGYAELNDKGALDVPKLAKPFTEADLARHLANYTAFFQDTKRVVSLRAAPR
jgi:PAS domain S-box-containing protein